MERMRFQNKFRKRTQPTHQAPVKLDRTRASLLRQLVIVFVVALMINYPWELAQSVLFVRPTSSKGWWWHCLVASAGDGLLVCLIYLAGYGVFGRQDWHEQARARHYAVMLGMGALVAIAVEWVAMDIAKRWEYTDSMPLVPLIDIGIVPIVQMLALPPVIFALAAAYHRRVGRDSADCG